MINRIIKQFLQNRFLAIAITIAIIALGIVFSPFNWKIDMLPSYPIPVDAIPDIGENQQIIYTPWEGASPQDIQDQITYPLTTYLMGISGVKTIRSNSAFGFSSIYIIFDESVEFYWSRTRIIEKITAIPENLLPTGVKPMLGPDATALAQVFWYTIEGRDKNGNTTGGWDLHEIRSVQDFYVKYSLNTVDGVSEVSSIGGFVKEYQINVNPESLQYLNVSLKDVVTAIQKSNNDIGSKTIEINQVEYLVRGLGYIKTTDDIEEIVIKEKDNVPIRVKDVAIVNIGPSIRDGILDKGGAEVVGGVVVCRYGANPLQIINSVKEKIKTISKGLPKKVLSDGTESQLAIVPFYDRSKLIYETLNTLEEALTIEILIAVFVILLMLRRITASILVSSLLPIAILGVFIAMKYFRIDANIVALSGIAIAIGTMVDLGIVIIENIVTALKKRKPNSNFFDIVYNATKEVTPAVVTSVSTTIVSFIPIFALQAAEGKLFTPLAYTKTFALVFALIVAVLILPTLAYYLFLLEQKALPNIKAKVAAWISKMKPNKTVIKIWDKVNNILIYRQIRKAKGNVLVVLLIVYTTYVLVDVWEPLGHSRSFALNTVFIVLILGVILLFFLLLIRYYERVLLWCLSNAKKFLTIPTIIVIIGGMIWLGFGTMFGWVDKGMSAVGVNIRESSVWSYMSHKLPGIGKAFMPRLDEGSFLYMPTSMPHSGIEYNKESLKQLDLLIQSVPEVDLVIGKAGRTASALDPAPISMYENLIAYKDEFITDENGNKRRFKTDRNGHFVLNSGEKIDNETAIIKGIGKDELINDSDGKVFRNWREKIKSPDDIWNEIIYVAKIPGITSAPKLQPIETRLVMLQTGMRSPFGIKVFGPSLKVIQDFSQQLEGIVKTVYSVKKEAVFADRVVGKPYINLVLNRKKMALYGLKVADVQQVISVAIGGKPLTYTIEGRERYPVRVRYPRALRSSPEEIGNILVNVGADKKVLLKQVVDIQYMKGPQAIKSENTFLVGYVLFDKKSGFDDGNVVEDVKRVVQQNIDDGQLVVPDGVNITYAGSYENQIRAEKRLSMIVPIIGVIILFILYMQFRSFSIALVVFSSVFVAFSGGFMMIWLYGQDWFLDFTFFDIYMRDVFQISPISLSVAVWVGFIALFGIATDDGVLMATYIFNKAKEMKADANEEVKNIVVEAGKKRIRPAVMTTITTIIALLPILTSNGRGADIMIPMSIPVFGGMLVAVITYFVVPVLYYVINKGKI